MMSCYIWIKWLTRQTLPQSMPLLSSPQKKRKTYPLSQNQPQHNKSNSLKTQQVNRIQNCIRVPHLHNSQIWMPTSSTMRMTWINKTSHLMLSLRNKHLRKLSKSCLITNMRKSVRYSLHSLQYKKYMKKKSRKKFK